VLLGEVEQDRVAVEDDGIAVFDHRRLAVRVQRPERVAVLVAATRIDRHRLIRQAELFQQQADLGGVRREIEMELQHRGGSSWGVPHQTPARCGRQVTVQKLRTVDTTLPVPGLGDFQQRRPIASYPGDRRAATAADVAQHIGAGPHRFELGANAAHHPA